MNPEQVLLVKTSWTKVAPIAPQAAELFYERLFELDPTLRALFKNDIHAQGIKLMRAINLVVKSLDQLDALLPTVRALGQRHVNYGVQAAHYDTVGAALLWTLQQGLGSDFTMPTRAAWTEAYTLLASVMKDAAQTNIAA